jgi:Helicase
VAIDEAAAIPLPTVKKLMGPYLVFMSSTGNTAHTQADERVEALPVFLLIAETYLMRPNDSRKVRSGLCFNCNASSAADPLTLCSSPLAQSMDMRALAELSH